MLIAVVGSSGINRVEGISSEHPAALLQADAATSAGHVLLLAPWYAESIAKEQAHVLIAASPGPPWPSSPRHHPLTLTLIGAAAQQTAGADADPGLVVALVNAAVARSRSLVWYPRVWGLREPSPTAFQLLASTFRSRGTSGRSPPSRLWSRPRPVAGGSDRRGVRRRQQPDAAAPPPRWRGGPADADRLEPHQPYATRSAMPLTVLAGVGLPPGSEPPCSSCDARLVAGACAFCGHAADPAAGARQVLELVDHG